MIPRNDLVSRVCFSNHEKLSKMNDFISQINDLISKRMTEYLKRMTK